MISIITMISGSRVEKRAFWPGEHLVDLEVWVKVENSQVTTPGKATVRLPKRAGSSPYLVMVETGEKRTWPETRAGVFGGRCYALISVGAFLHSLSTGLAWSQVLASNMKHSE